MSKEKLLLIGAGGFGRMMAEQAMYQYDCAFVDDGQAETQRSVAFWWLEVLLICLRSGKSMVC